MPIYEARCNKCKNTTEYNASIQNMYQTPLCCNTPMEKVILTPQPGYVDNPHFMSRFRSVQNGSL